MKKYLVILISVLTLSMLVSCNDIKEIKNRAEAVEHGNATDSNKEQEEIKTINDYVTIREEVNGEYSTPNGDMEKYIYKVPILNIDKPVAKEINEKFSKIEKDMEDRIGNGQNMTITIDANAFLNNGMISIIMNVHKTSPGGLYVVNYDIKSDKELETKQILEKSNFKNDELITKINEKKDETQNYVSVDFFVETILTNMYNSSDKYFQKSKEMQDKTKEEKEKFVVENIDKLNCYINSDGKLVFIYTGQLSDETFIVE